MKVSIHMASHIDTRLAIARVVGLGLASQASRVYLRGMSIYTATGEAFHEYSISHVLYLDVFLSAVI